VLEVDIK